MPTLPKNIHFIRGKYPYKYTAILPDGKRVNFGHADYQHYKDSVPVNLGGGKWSHKNHGDSIRRRNYRARHRGILNRNGDPAYAIRYTPCWFSYYFLW